MIKVHQNQDTAKAAITIENFTMAVNQHVTKANQEMTEGFFRQAYDLGYRACLEEFGISPTAERVDTDG